MTAAVPVRPGAAYAAAYGHTCTAETVAGCEACQSVRALPNYCPRQARRTPVIPWHNGYPRCLACGQVTR